MRKIKFRAFDKAKKEMFYLPVKSGENKNWLQIDKTGINVGTQNGLLPEKEFELMQFTGLVDKNGVEIYEGDILSDWNEVDGKQVQSFLQVFWCSETGAWKLDNSFNQDKSSGDLLSEELNSFSYEITGNIYENPELK